MGVFDRYVLRETALAWLAVTGVLLAILVGNQLARTLGLAAANGFPGTVVLALIGLTTLQYLTVLVPVATLLAVMLALGRLYHDSEMAAVRACGIGPGRLLIPVMALAAPAAALLAWLAFDVSPEAYGRAQQLRQQAMMEARFGQLEPGKFRSFGDGETVFYAESRDPDGALREVFLQRRVGDGIELAVADRAEHRILSEGRRHDIILFDGVRYEGVPGQATFREVAFEEHGIPVLLPETGSIKDRVDARSTATLLGSSDPEEVSELQWRVSLPLMTLLLAVLAIPLSALKPREGRYAKVAVGVVVYFLYSNLLSAARAWVEKEDLTPALGLWWVHLLLAGLALWLFHRQSPLWKRRVRA